jgi:chemotaxis protein MotB
MKKGNDVPIRVVRKKKGHHGHHGGAWKVAYADFVTAMMSLFIVLWIVGQSKQVKQYVASYFRDPGAFAETSKGGGPFDKNNSIAGDESVEEQFLKRQQENLRQTGETILKELQSRSALAELSKQIKMEIVKEGLRIELVDVSESFFFEIGTANLNAAAIDVLGVIAKDVGRLPNHVIVEGHTDSRPYSRADGYSNFELSADRANSARRVLVRSGLGEEKIDEVRGYANTRLRNKQDPYDITNRRISIIIKFEEPSTP